MSNPAVDCHDVPSLGKPGMGKDEVLDKDIQWARISIAQRLAICKKLDGLKEVAKMARPFL